MNSNQSIFYSEKNDWKEDIDFSRFENKSNILILKDAARWAKSRSKIDEFWNEIENEKIKKNDYDFSNFIFPPAFNPNSFFSHGNIAFEEDVNFSNAKFLGPVHFRKEHFKGKVNFSHTVFKDYCFFDHSTFEDDLIFDYAIFENQVKLSGDFPSKVRIKKCEYFTQISLTKASFSNLIFQDNFSIEKKHFKNYSYRQVLALTKLLNADQDFSKKNIEKNIKRIKSLHDADIKELNKLVKLIRKDKHLNENSSLHFDLVQMSNHSEIKRVDLRKASFIGTNLEEIRFLACKWNASNRLIIEDENLIQKFGYNPKNNRFKNIELSYRQLKLNFENKKDWELAGKAYISQMTNRKVRLFSEGKIVEYVFYEIYGIFGFNQNFIHPLKVFLFLSLLLFPVLYYHYGELLYWNSLKLSVTNSFPLLDYEIPETYYRKEAIWYISSSQLLLSTISLTFLIISLKNRFR